MRGMLGERGNLWEITTFTLSHNGQERDRLPVGVPGSHIADCESIQKGRRKIDSGESLTLFCQVRVPCARRSAR